MKISIGEVDGKGWQDPCDLLLRQRYNDYQKIPSRFGGDLGLEGFTRSEGIVFQCYCPDSNPPQKELYEAQRNKITRDIRKLLAKSNEIKKIIGNCTIKEWHFVTPDYNSKELLEHCNKKEYEVKSAKKNHIDNEHFRIVIKIEADFIPELEKIRGHLKINPEIEKVSDDRVVEWRALNNKLLSALEGKGQKVIEEENKLNEFVNIHIYNFLMGQIAFERLQIHYPELYQQIIQTKGTIESKIEMESLISTDIGPYNIIEKALKEYKQILKDLTNDTLSENLKMILALESVSDWLIRCPLDFN